MRHFRGLRLIAIGIATTIASASATARYDDAGAPPWSPSIGPSVASEISAATARPSLSNTELVRGVTLLDDEFIATGDGSSGAWGLPEVWRWTDRTGWTKTQNLTPFDLPPNDISINHKYIALVANEMWAVASEPSYAPNGVIIGALHVFRRTAAGDWAWHGLIANPASPSGPEQFGAALALDGSTLVVGVPLADTPAGIDRGRCDLFTITERGPEFTGSLVLPSGLPVTPQLGQRLALDGDTLVVGTPTATIPGGGTAKKGAISIFTRATPDDAFVLASILLPTALPLASIPNFGEWVDVDGDRIAVSASGASVPGIGVSGAAWIFERTKRGFELSASVLGEEPLEGLGPLDLDGNRLSIGSPGYIDPAQGPSCSCSGRARLFAIDGPMLTLIADVRPEGGLSLDDWVGKAIALRNGWWAVTSRRGWGSMTASIVALRRFDGAGADCDGDGTPNGIEVTRDGAVDANFNLVPDACESTLIDCDENGVPDAIDVALIPSWVGTPELGPGTWTVGGVGVVSRLMLFVSTVTVPADSDGVLRGVQTDWMGSAGTTDTLLAIYADPNQDRLPSDAALLWIAGTHATTARGDERFAVPPLAIGAPGTSFFIALGAVEKPPGQWSRLGTDAVPSPDTRTWLALGTAATFDFEHPDANQFWQVLGDGTATIHAAALFSSLADLDGDGSPDGCQCPGDFDLDGSVGPADLSILLGGWSASATDLDGDGITGASDLAELLAAWGRCHGP